MNNDSNFNMDDNAKQRFEEVMNRVDIEENENEKNITYKEENKKLKEKIEELKAEVNQWRYEKEERAKRNRCELVDSSYTLKLGQTPKLIFVSQHGTSNGETLYIDGKIVQGIVSFNLFSSIGEPTRHTVEYNTCQAK
jgi:hypothetical protein